MSIKIYESRFLTQINFFSLPFYCLSVCFFVFFLGFFQCFFSLIAFQFSKISGYSVENKIVANINFNALAR